MKFLIEARKTVAALSGAASVAVAEGLLNGTAQEYVVGGLAVVTAFIVYFVPNGTSVAE